MILKTISEAGDPKFKKYVFRLKEPARRAKQSLQNVLEKSVKHFQDQVEKSTSEKEKSLFLKKREKISNDLDVLKVLSEDDIIKYALSTSKKIVSIASNPRIPPEVRMKARVAAHKPLSTHILQLKQKFSESHETSSESDPENESAKNSSTLNKITFNNTIVSMRKDVRRAKVHIIHRLTRNIKKLRTAKGNENKVAKNQKKADRLYNKVIHIKELLEDDISKFALASTQNPEVLANDIKVSMTSRAMATVAINQFVASHVSNFRNKYPDWQKTVPNLLKKKSKKRKLKLEIKDNENNSDNLSQEKAGSDISQSDSESNEENKSENNEESESGNGRESESENSGESSEESGEEEGSDTQENVTSQDKTDEEDNSDSSDEVLNSMEVNGKGAKNIQSENPKKIKLSKETTKVKNDKSKGKQINKKSERKVETSLSSSHIEAKPPKDTPKVIDPFFVTSTNEEYITSQVPITSGDNLTSGNVEQFHQNKPGKFNKFENNKKWDQTGNEKKHGKFNRFHESAQYKSSGSFDKYSDRTRSNNLVFGNRKERRKALHQPQIEEKVEKLHPSWEAKKKQSSIIPFQGKKVTFD